MCGAHLSWPQDTPSPAFLRCLMLHVSVSALSVRVCCLSIEEKKNKEMGRKGTNLSSSSQRDNFALICTLEHQLHFQNDI